MSEDYEMEDEEKTATVQTGEQSAGGQALTLTLTAELSKAVYEALKERVPEPEWEMKLGPKARPLIINESAARQGGEGYRDALRLAVSDAYDEVGGKYVRTATDATMTKLRDILGRKLPQQSDHVVMARLASEFQAPYYGDADTRFRKYLERCCAANWVKPNRYTSPYVAISQSSGFGKSRLLYNLAKQAADGGTESAEGAAFSMRVLYVCARSGAHSSGYPVATKKLKEWFFQETYDETDISTQLVEAFRYGRQNWNTVGSQWLGLLTDKNADAAVVKKLDKFHSQQAPNKKQATSGVTPVLVFAVDEARALLEAGNLHGVSFFRLLRRALTMANADLEADGLIFAVLVDINSKIHDFVPPWSSDPSSRRGGVLATAFPPFVLTHTNDVLFVDPISRGPIDYEASVTSIEEGADWKTLVSMGRPLWARCGKENKSELIDFAASKLLLGSKITSSTSYNNETLRGVASLFCRLGLRPHSTNYYASRMVADFMAVLHYVNHTNEAHITSYASEPILALGATRLLRELDSPALEQFILPQFEEMLVQGVVDTGGIGEVVARIFLLLAMDKAVEQTFTTAGGAKLVLAGQFCPVPAFLKLLYGFSPEFCDATKNSALKKRDAEKSQKNFDTWVAGWNDWKVGFCQFVELPKKPTKRTLWFLLGRRAAAVLPRNQAGADLLIPIFSDHKVSFVLVQVKNIFGNDNEFPATATTKLTTESSFGEGHELSGKSPRDMIRLYMNLQSCYTTNPPQCILVEKAGAEYSAADKYSVVLRGMCRPPKQHVDTTPRIWELWPFLSEEVTNRLERIAKSPWWDAAYAVKMDLGRRDKAENAEALKDVMPKEELHQIAEWALLSVPF